MFRYLGISFLQTVAYFIVLTIAISLVPPEYRFILTGLQWIAVFFLAYFFSEWAYAKHQLTWKHLVGYLAAWLVLLVCLHLILALFVLEILPNYLVTSEMIVMFLFGVVGNILSWMHLRRAAVQHLASDV